MESWHKCIFKKGGFCLEKGGNPGDVQLLEIVGHNISQTIDFASLPTKTFGDAPFELTATASSGLPITYISSDPTVAFINGNKVTIIGVGITAIVAHQAGDEFFMAAPTVKQLLTVNAANLTQPYLIGMATGGGSAQGDGTIFRINTNGDSLKVLHTYHGGDGRYPLGKLIQSPSGALYGMTMQGGFGTIFKIKADSGDLDVIHYFNLIDGMGPRGSLTQTSDGSFLGMTEAGGKSSVGTIFKINADGSGHEVLYNFGADSDPFPSGSLIQTSDDMLYGMTGVGGPLGGGTIFRINPDGTNYITLHNFDNSASGGNPVGSSLLQTMEGSLVGMTYLGGTSSFGVIFKMDTDGNNFSVIHNFNGPNGAHPWGSLIQSPDGLLYGMTKYGGALGAGTIFKINADGSGHAVLYSFNGLDGSQPQGSLIISNNKLYGYTTFGGTINGGVLFKFDVATSSYTKLADLDNTTGINPERGSLSLVYLKNGPPRAIKDFSLTYFRSGNLVSDFSEALTLDVADPQIEKYTIRANGTDEEIGSVKFTLDGVTTNIDNTKPYTISHWLLPVLSEGVHTISAQGYSRNNAQGEGFEIREAFIYVTSSAAVTQFDIVDENGNKIKSIFDGETINIGQPELQYFNVVARTNISTTRSVKFTLNDVTARIDNRAPYAVSGKANGNEKPWLIRPGNYTLTATPFMKYNAWGPPGIPLTINFTVINDALPSQIVMRDELLASRENVTSGSAEELSSPQLHVYPTPVKDELHISWNDSINGKVVLKVMDINGRSLYSMEGTAQTIHGLIISTNQVGLSSGLYILCIQNQNGKILRTRFLKE